MSRNLPVEGAASPELSRKAIEWWIEAATRGGLDLTGFNASAPLAERLSWARSVALEIGGDYARYSMKEQHSTEDQVRGCISYAGLNRIFVPPEFICIDEAVKGRRSRRKGLARMLAILEGKYIDTLLVFKASRIFRKAHKSMAFIDEEVVERGIRAISVFQGIDTANTQGWRLLFGIHSLIDEQFVDSLGDYVRNSLKGVFLEGHVTGALGVGYRRREVPGAKPTKRGLPTTEAEVDPEAKKLIRQHFEWIDEGMSLAAGQRRWVKAGGPCDPRSSLGYMTPQAYRRMLSNTRYIGLWEFGRKRNRWSSKKDYTEQVVQPDEEVEVRRCEHLRIVSDQLFYRVQARLAKGCRGKHNRRGEDRPVHLWNLVTNVFHCPRCDRQFYQRGAFGRSMGCGDPMCSARGTVPRDKAVEAVCGKLAELVTEDHELVHDLVGVAQNIEERNDQFAAEREEAEREVARLKRKAGILVDVIDVDDDKGADDLKAKLKAMKEDLNRWHLKLAKAKAAEGKPRRIVTPDAVKSMLADLQGTLEAAASGELGDDMIHRTADLFCRLVGNRVYVHFEVRPGRKRTLAKAVFVPELLEVAKERLGIPDSEGSRENATQVSLWLRGPPRIDRTAGEVRRLYEDEGLGFREIGDRLECGSGNACHAYRRWYESRGLPVPPARRPGGRPRKER